jgi:Spy/CpxP family protein refolding chaperone
MLTIIAGAVVVLGLLSWGAYAHWGHRHNRVDWIAKRLNLDDQQKAKLEAVHEALRQARAEFKKERAELFDELEAQIKSDQLDQAKVLQLLERRQAIMNQVAPQVIAKVAELHATLTPEQKAKVIEHLERRKERLQQYH